jgi:signal transduction histidine kinase
MTTNAPYSGPDRRARTDEGDRNRRHGLRVRAVSGDVLLGVFATALGSVAALGLLAGRYVDPLLLAQARQGLASLAMALFVSAALAYLLRWKVTGEAPVALVGVALLAYGGLLGLLSPLATAASGGTGPAAAGSGVLRTLVSAVTIYLLIRSLSTPSIDTRLRPGRILAVTALGVASVLTVLIVVLRLTAGDVVTTELDIGLEVVLALAWAAAAGLFLRRAARRLQGDVLWIGIALGCISLSDAVHATAVTRSASGLLIATGIAVLAGAVALFGTTLRLTQTLAGLGGERMRLHEDLTAIETHSSSQQATREERLHDVRSTLAAIRCAAGTLQRYDERLEPSQRESLQSAVTNELIRLEHLIDPTEAAGVDTFRLDAVLASVLETKRSLGTVLHVDLGQVSVKGRRNDTVRIIQNLLSNARLHAPGTPVHLYAAVRDGIATVSVTDGGPGIPADQREAVFDRGHRGERGGTGLGLYVARQLAREQGGDLVVTDGPGSGARFELRLPAGRPVAPMASMVTRVVDVTEASISGRSIVR